MSGEGGVISTAESASGTLWPGEPMDGRGLKRCVSDLEESRACQCVLGPEFTDYYIIDMA